MKVDSHLTLVRGQEEVTPKNKTGAPGPSKEADPAFRDLLALVSQENQRARELHPTGLQEARRLLEGVTRALRNEPLEVLSDTHRLRVPCLVRLL